MSSSSNNIWIRLIRAYIQFIKDIGNILTELLTGKMGEKKQYKILQSALETGPKKYKKNPTAIKAGRSISAFFLSIIYYDKK